MIATICQESGSSLPLNLSQMPSNDAARMARAITRRMTDLRNLNTKKAAIRTISVVTILSNFSNMMPILQDLQPHVNRLVVVENDYFSAIRTP